MKIYKCYNFEKNKTDYYGIYIFQQSQRKRATIATLFFFQK